MVHNAIEYGMMQAIGEGMENKVSLPVLTASLYARWQSQKDSYSAKIVAALREQFGGHGIIYK